MEQMKNYIVRDNDGTLCYDHMLSLKPDGIKALDHGLRLKILKLLTKKPMYPAEIASRLRQHEQKIYYHIGLLLGADLLEIVEKKEIRGTTAKKFRARSANFSYTLRFKEHDIKELFQESKDDTLTEFLSPFISNGKLDAKIIVGSPDPHGPFKARARDGHFAIDLALFLGRHAGVPKEFSTMLDVDNGTPGNRIIVGGPVTNGAMAKVNDFLPARFSDKKPWGIIGRDTYTDDNIGLLARVPHPKSKKHHVLAVAGVRYGGTRSAVLALTRFSKLALSRFSGQKKFYAIVQGYDLDGDGKVDSVELFE